MSLLIVPHPDADEFVWPTLGPQVVSFLNEMCCYGPGPLLGQPYVCSPEFEAWLWRAYEIYPKVYPSHTSDGRRHPRAGEVHPRAGRRRFKRCVLSKRKGLAKTEEGAVLAGAEAHPDGPVRCVGWDAQGQPVGAGLVSIYIPMVAYTDDQSEELAYGALKAIAERSPIGEVFDVGAAFIARRDGSGRIVHLATSPDSRDGARTTFQLFDETHRLKLHRQVAAHSTMSENLLKITEFDPWGLELTTSFSPGEGSVAESSFDEANLILHGKAKNPGLFFFHRQASETPLDTDDQLRTALLDATDPSARNRTDVDAMVEHYRAPKTDRRYFERVWLNWPRTLEDQAYDINAARACSTEEAIKSGASVGLAFDGSRSNDSTALGAIDLESGRFELLGLWENDGSEGWEVDPDSVSDAVAQAFERFDVWRMYCDPPYWRSYISQWAGNYGSDIVVEWWCNRYKLWSYACRAFDGALHDGALSLVENEDLYRHIGNTRKEHLPYADDQGERTLWYIRKIKKDSPFKIDAAACATLAYQCYLDYMAAPNKVKLRRHRKRSRALVTF